MRTAAPDVEFSTRQLDEFAAWGLVHRGPDGWLPDTGERLRTIRTLGMGARSLPRRTLRIYISEDGFPIPAASILRAMVELAPTVPRGIRKLTRIARLRARWGSRQTVEEVRVASLPRQSEWARLLTRGGTSEVERLRDAWALQARAVLPAYASVDHDDLADIPVEERFVLVAILDLSRPSTHPGPPAILP